MSDLPENWTTGDTLGAEDFNAVSSAVNDVVEANADDDAGIVAALAAAATADAKAVAALSRANHTGSQPSSTISDFTEAAQDAVAALLAGASGVTLSYNDAANTLTITGGGSGGLDAEAVRDAIGVALVGTGLISVVVNDAADTITISTTATANATDAALRDRSTHTGTQPTSTVTNLDSTLTAKANLASPTFTGTVSGITKAMVGLGNADNTADNSKPISAAQQAALDLKASAVHTHVSDQVNVPAGGMPTFLAAGTLLGNADRTTVSVPVPVGTVANTVVLVFIDNTTTIPTTITPPAGFTLAPNAVSRTGSQGTQFRVYWKRCTGTDSGTYDFVFASSNFCKAVAVAFSGVNPTGNPIDVDTSAANVSATLDGVGITTTAANSLLVWAAETWSSVTVTPPSGFTSRSSYSSSGSLAISTGPAAAVGFTGTKTGTISGSSGWGVWMGALKADASATVTLTNALSAKAPLADPTFTGTVSGVTAAMVGLGSVDNTADNAKPVSAAQSAAINAREPAISAGTTSQYWRGDKTWQPFPGATAFATAAFDVGTGTRRIISSMAKALAGTGVSEHLIIGDSMSSAYTGAAFDFANSWHRKLKAKLLASGYPDGGTGLIATNEANSGGHDPRWTFSGTADTSSNVYVALGTAASTATFTSDTAGTIVDVVYSNAGGSFSVKIDGGTAVPVTATGALTIGTYTVTGLSNTTHTVVVTATSGSAIVCAAQVRNAAGVRFSSLGKYGLQAAGFLGDGGYVKSIAVGAMPSPDVVHIAIGANDMISGASAATTVTNVQAIRNLWPSADVILYVEPITENIEITDAAYGVFATGLRTLSVTLGCPLVDWNLRYGGGAVVTGMGFVGADGRHPNALAQADMSNVIYEGLLIASVASGVGARVATRVFTATAGATPTINTDGIDAVVISGLTVDITNMSTNLTGTPNSEDPLRFAITGTAARAISWGSKFENGAATLPTTTTLTQRLDVGFFWNSATAKWRCMTVASA